MIPNGKRNVQWTFVFEILNTREKRREGAKEILATFFPTIHKVVLSIVQCL